ncbi:18.1 kDa class I heat shock protein [Spatholobus suberectus]|nr:18.1 kDa class I heat shock protein [Spatholobus suberectus]
MSIIPNTNPFEDSPFTALSTSPLSRDAAFLSSQFDWQESPDAHVLTAEVPGLTREEVKVEVEDGGVLQDRDKIATATATAIHNNVNGVFVVAGFEFKRALFAVCLVL